MCIIIVKPQGAEMPPYETLRYCAMRNPDGFGFAVPGKIFKSMNFGVFYRELAKTVTTDTPAIIHLRIATHGWLCTSNCHPFRDEKSGVSFAHNGVLGITPDKGKTDSETAFRKVIMPAIREGGFGSRQMDEAVLGVIGVSRFAFLTDQGEIKLYGHFTGYQNCWFSNTGFLPY